MQPKRRFWKFALALAALLVVSSAAFYFGFFDPAYWRAWQQERAAQKIWEELQAQRRREAEDPYGGKTPEELYQLFVQALEKQDIELAVKYFEFGYQEEVREALVEIQGIGNWQSMYDAFSGKTSRIEYEVQQEGDYLIHIRAIDDGRPRAALHAKKNPNSNLWKFTRAWL